MPKLIVIRGEKRGEIAIAGKLKLGRAKESDIVIYDRGVGRSHAEIVKSEGTYFIRDLDSRNGTFVDGKKIKEAVLKNGSRISVAGWTAIFSDETTPTVGLDTTSITWVEDDKRFSTSTSTVEKTIATETQDRSSEALHIGDPHILHARLKLLDDIGKLIHSLRDTDDLLNEIARQCLSAFADCDSCFIIFEGLDVDNPSIRAALQRTKDGMDSISGAQTDVRLSRTIIKRALESGESIYCLNAPQDTEFKGVKSIADLNIYSFLCAPLIRGGEGFGVIYLDSRRPNVELGESDLRLLSAIANEAALAIENAELHQELRLAKECLEEENRKLRQEMGDEFHFEGIIGSSPAMRDAIERAKKVASTDASVFIAGESGVGKELFAQAIHCNSPRSAGPFEDFNCAIGESLIETELFGIGPWAATGVKPRPGLFERANGGTIFLDEIGDMPLDTQAKLLRVLQEGTVRRTGTAKNIEVDVRIIAATNKDLETEIKAGRFRNDLYYRFAAVKIHVPPLRERREDILRLADYFLTKYNFRHGREIEGFSLSAQQAFVSYPWDRNNVRELEKQIEEIIIFADKDALIAVEDLPPEIAQAGGTHIPEPPGELPPLEEAQRRVILEKLKETGANIKRSAKELGVSQQGLRNKIGKYGLWGLVEEARGDEKA